MRTSFDQARNAIAFLEYHRLEPSAVHYGLTLLHLSGSYPTLSHDIATSIEDGNGPSEARFAELAITYASDLGFGIGIGIGSFASRLATTERDLSGLRLQLAGLKARIDAGGGIAVDAERDGLTNALNQIGARRVLERLGAQDQRYVVLMFSIDGLVAINREFGNTVGDNILNAFAAKLSKTFPEQEAIRWAGNEFIVVIPGRTVTAVRELAEEVLALLEQRKFRLRESGEAIGTVTASAAIVSDHGGDIEGVLEEARGKLMLAMRDGGNRVEA